MIRYSYRPPKKCLAACRRRSVSSGGGCVDAQAPINRLSVIKTARNRAGGMASDLAGVGAKISGVSISGWQKY